MNNSLSVDLIESGLAFNYSNVDGDAFHNASGLIIITNVANNDQPIEIDFDLNIFFLYGENVYLDTSDLPENLEDLAAIGFD